MITEDSPDLWVKEEHKYQIYDFHLRSGSPCIDKGTNSDPGIPFNLPSIDKDENHRIWYGNTSWTVDMGAFEFDSEPLAITNIERTGDEGTDIELTWISSPAAGTKYDVWYCEDPYSSTEGWSKLDENVLTEGSTTTWTDTSIPPDPGHRFYKVSYGSY